MDEVVPVPTADDPVKGKANNGRHASTATINLKAEKGEMEHIPRTEQDTPDETVLAIFNLAS